MDLFKRLKFLFLFIAVISAGCNNNSNVTSQQREWSTQIINSSDMITKSLYPASINGCQDVEIRPQIQGIIEEIKIKEGENVRKGQILFIIEQLPYKAALNEAIANVKVAQASLATAKLNYESKKILFDKKVISQVEMQTANNAMLSAQGVLLQCEAAELTARNNLSYTEIKSPVNGVAGTLPFRQGSLVNPNMSQPLTMVSDNSKMHIYFSISETQALALIKEWGSIDKAVNNMDKIELVLSDGTLYEQKGKVESISGIVDKNTGAVSIRALFENNERKILSGARGNVQITTDHKNIIAIPQGATLKIQDKYLVYKVVDGKAKSSQVEVYPYNNGVEYIVLSGLDLGDVIVSDGVGLLREGMSININ